MLVFVAKPKDIPPEFVEAFKDTVYLFLKYINEFLF